MNITYIIPFILHKDNSSEESERLSDFFYNACVAAYLLYCTDMIIISTIIIQDLEVYLLSHKVLLACRYRNI